MVFLVLFLAFVASGIATAIGMLRMRFWALASTRLFSPGLLTMGVVLAAIMALLAAVGAAGVARWWIIYPLLPRTRAAFRAARPAGTRRLRPLSIVPIAWLSILGAEPE